MHREFRFLVIHKSLDDDFDNCFAECFKSKGKPVVVIVSFGLWLRGIVVGVITRCICAVAPILIHVVQAIATVATEREIVIVGT